MTDREIMQQALDAMMDAMRVSGGISDKMFESVNAISERLAQPDPRNQCGETCERAKLCAVCLAEMGTQPDPLQRLTDVQQEIEAALAQPEQKPVLQDIEQYRMQMASISTAAIGYWKEGDGIHPDYDTPALRDVAMLYAKYDALYKAQPAQEPVVVIKRNESGQITMQTPDGNPFDMSKYIGAKLYTAPQQREWQGAFFDAVYEAWHSAGMDVLGGDWNTFASTLEAKLKETK